MTPDGVGEVHDFMPVTGSAPTDWHRLVRNIRVVRGVMRFAIEIQPRFDYARKPHKVDVTEHGVVFASDGLELTIHGIAPEGSSLAEAGITLERAGDGLRWTRTLREGETGGVVLESMGGPPRRVTPEEALQLQDDTARFWRSWLHRVELHRPVAGDGQPVGYHAEAADLRADRRAGCRAHHRAPRADRRGAELGLPLHLDPGRVVLHLRAAGPGVRGRSRGVRRLAARPRRRAGRERLRPAEDHVPGRRHLGPGGGEPGSLRGLARVPAGADRQRRGRPAAAGHLRRGDGLHLPGRQLWHRGGPPGWTDLARIIDWLCERWDQPDEGIWETRGGQRNFTYGRFQTWVALDRAIRLATKHGRPASIARWTNVRDQVYNQIMDGGWNPKVGAFTQHYDTEVLDFSLLMMPLIASWTTARERSAAPPHRLSHRRGCSPASSATGEATMRTDQAEPLREARLLDSEHKRALVLAAADAQLEAGRHRASPASPGRPGLGASSSTTIPTSRPASSQGRPGHQKSRR